MLKFRRKSSGTVFSIMTSALIFGLAVGFPCGYLAHQAAVKTPNTSLALSQK